MSDGLTLRNAAGPKAGYLLAGRVGRRLGQEVVGFISIQPVLHPPRLPRPS